MRNKTTIKPAITQVEAVADDAAHMTMSLSQSRN